MHHTSSLCLAGKPEIIIVLMKCRIVEKFFSKGQAQAVSVRQETVEYVTGEIVTEKNLEA